MSKLSVIVPVYNTHKYLAKCLDSLINQTLKEIEIICVDDGSTDSSLNILKEYSNKDGRIKVIEQTHQKQGAARNNGIRHAEGEYIGFVDSDDWVDLGFFEKLYETAKKYNSDIAIAANVRIGNGITKKRLNFNEEKLVSDIQERFDICSLAKNPCPTNKIYKAELLKNHNIAWPEDCYCEDRLFVTKAVYYAQSVVCVPDVYYYYFRNPDSTVNSSERKHLKELITDKNNARKSVINFLREQNAPVADKGFHAIKSEYKMFGINFLSVKITLRSKKYYLFGILPIFSLQDKGGAK